MNLYRIKHIFVLFFFTACCLIHGVGFSGSAQAAPVNLYSANSAVNEENSGAGSGLLNDFLFDSSDNMTTLRTGLGRTIPQIFGEKTAGEYPSPSNTIADTERMAEVYNENQAIMNRIETDISNNSLKKHIAADFQFGAAVADDACAVEKIVYINTNLKGSHSLGVFAPAGEIVTVTVPEEFMYMINSKRLSVAVGAIEANSDAQCNTRMPIIAKSFTLTQKTIKVGNPFGGMIFFTLSSIGVPSGLTIPVTVSGGVDTPYYDLGSTTPIEWEQSRNSPGLFAELRTPYMRILVPATEVRDIEDPSKALTFWTNVGALSSYVFNEQAKDSTVTMLYDYYVSFGAAYAIIGAWCSHIPLSWFSGFMDYENLIKNGQWGEIHEYNHHWQGDLYGDIWGAGDVEEDVFEVTNNVLNAASYILYTNIAAYRTVSGLADSNNVADPYFSLKEVLSPSENGLPVKTMYMYVSLMHEFGVEKALEVIRSCYFGGTFNGIQIEKQCSWSGNRYEDFAYRTCVITGKDLSYYFAEVLKFPISGELADRIKNLGFEPYIPIQNLFSAGVKGVETGRPFFIPNQKFIFDFEKYTVAGGDFEIIFVGKPLYGALSKNADGTYTYTPAMQNNEIDEFELEFSISASGITQERVLVCRVGISYEAAVLEKYSVNSTKIDTAIAESQAVAPYEAGFSNGINYTCDSGKNFSKGTGWFWVKESGEYEIQAYGDDIVRFVMFEGANTYTSEIKSFSPTVEEAYSNAAHTRFTVQLEKNTAYRYTLYTLNTGYTGFGAVGFRRSGGGDAAWFQPDICQGQEEIFSKTDRSFDPPAMPSYTRPLSRIVLGSSIDLSGAKVLSTPKGTTDNSIIDKNKNTFFDTGKLNYPHNYIIDLGEAKKFNRMDIYAHADKGNTAVGDYIVFVADEYLGEQTDWRIIASDNSRYDTAFSDDIHAGFQESQARYVKLCALNNKNRQGNTVVSEIEFSYEMTAPQIIAKNSEIIQYEGQWSVNTDGCFIGTSTFNSSSGVFRLGLIGSRLAVYSAKDAEIRFRVNSGDWETSEFHGYSEGFRNYPSLLLEFGSNEIYMLEIEVLSGELALDIMATDGYFTQYKIEEPPIDDVPPIDEEPFFDLAVLRPFLIAFFILVAAGIIVLVIYLSASASKKRRGSK